MGCHCDDCLKGWGCGPRLWNLFQEMRAEGRGSVTRLLLERARLLCPEVGLLFNTSYSTAASDNALFVLLPVLDSPDCWNMTSLTFSVLCLQSTFMLVSCLAYSSTLKMEATCFSEMSVDIQGTTRRHNPEYQTFRNRWCENFKPYIFVQQIDWFKAISTGLLEFL
jgi:hypothetical protein